MIRNHFIAVAALLFAASASAQQPAAQPVEYQEGVHYQRIDDASAVSSGPVVVTELFSYYCPHCATFEPFMQAWLEDKPDNVEFQRIPVVFGNRSWQVAARGYVTADMMGVADEAHVPMMNAIHQQRRQFRDVDALAAFYADYGVDADAFVATASSFAVDARMRREQQTAQRWGVSGTPAMVVDGRYRIGAGGAVRSYQMMLDIVDHLVAMEQAKRGVADTEGAEAEAAPGLASAEPEADG